MEMLFAGVAFALFLVAQILAVMLVSRPHPPKQPEERRIALIWQSLT